MGAHWQGKARAAGYGPKDFRDAYEGEGLRAVVSFKHMRGAVIGDGEKCSGARCLKDHPEIEWCYVGASVAYVAFTDGRRVRYLVNGLPKGQDRTMNVAGEEIILRPASKTQTIRAFRRRLAKARKAGLAKSSRVENGSRSRSRSLAAALRNVD